MDGSSDSQLHAECEARKAAVGNGGETVVLSFSLLGGCEQLGVKM
jgi:hypothetical protein